jgi:hypothetical protein
MAGSAHHIVQGENSHFHEDLFVVVPRRHDPILLRFSDIHAAQMMLSAADPAGGVPRLVDLI